MIAPSIMCISEWHDTRNIFRQLKVNGIAMIHADVMDGKFVPNLMLGTESIKHLREVTDIPLDIHMMVEKPEEKLDWFDIQPGEYVSVHAESTRHLQRTLAKIADYGAHPMVALNPATPLCMLEDVLDDVSGVLLMTVNPGFAGQKLVPQTLGKITRLRELLDKTGHEEVFIEVDGNVSFENAPKMYHAGARAFVCGTSSIFGKNGSIEENIAKFKKVWRNKDMICETFDIKNENSQEYARLNTYLISHSDSIKTETRPLIILCPGGGYWFTSEREGEMLALQFVAAGFHAAILWYSVKPATFPTALLELAKSVELVRKHAKEWYVDPDKIVVEGCSAGGHLAASYGVFWHEDFVSNKLQVSKDILKPNGMILSYPVITSGEFAHRGSFNNLLRDQYTEEMLEKTSLEKQVNEYVPRAFIWHTYEDTVVPVENSLLFATELRRHHIPVEFHLFERGCHGLSLANELTDNPQGERIQRECECWITMAIAWMHNL